MLSEHSRVYGKRLGTLRTKPPKENQRFPHCIGTENTQAALQVFTARSFSPTLLTRSVAQGDAHLRLLNISTPPIHVC